MKVRAGRLFWGGVAATTLGLFAGDGAAFAQVPRHSPDGAEFRFPTVRPGHRHARSLLANAMRYVSPEHRITDPISGYPYEVWNNDPERKLYLRSFTQLTAIGLWMEILANVAAGQADTPYLSREKALSQLMLVVKSLRQDQRDPQLGAKGLLGNFLDLSSGRRLGPLVEDAERGEFLNRFGGEKGAAIWKALVEKGWLIPRGNGSEAAVKRGVDYGAACFDGPLKPYCDAETTRKVMRILDRRTVMLVFGDNANLSDSAARTIGALLLPEVKDRPEAVAVRQELEKFLEAQREGYTRLYDPKVGLFYFGWDGQRDRLFGWEDKQGKWVTGYMDYLVNEFRGPALFVVLRHDLPMDAIKNLGFKMKPYRLRDGREKYTLAPWEGSAFQVLGLHVATNELKSPSGRMLLQNAVEIEIDYATRHKLPGFLSESYTGVGTQYTGDVGIPDIAVNPSPRVTDAASLYSLGPAYTIAPDDVEQFLAANWPAISGLMTEHGPWEGFNVSRQEPIRIQTTAHTLVLALGLLGNGSGHMKRYLESRGNLSKLGTLLRAGSTTDLMAERVQVFAWGPKDQPLKSVRDREGFRVTGEQVGEVRIAFVPNDKSGFNLSGGMLTLRYRSSSPAAPAVITLKTSAESRPGIIPTEIFTRFGDTGGREEEIRIPLPSTPGLEEVKEVVVTHGPGTERRKIDLTVTWVGSSPIEPANGQR